jgi:hypothetical protein
MNAELGRYLIVVVVVVDQLLLNEVNYRDDLARLMKKLILLSEVAYLSTRVSSIESARLKIVDRIGAYEAVFSKEHDVESEALPETSGSFDYSEAPESVTPGDRHFRSSEQIAISNLLDEWEEPELQGYQGEVSVHIVKLPDFMDVAKFLHLSPCIPMQDVTMASILQFRRALQFISDDFPFSQAFGSASTREKCIQSAQTVFERLVEHSADDETLDFETLCLVAKRPDGELDRVKVKELIRLFRPNRSGQLNKIDFVKSVDR